MNRPPQSGQTRAASNPRRHPRRAANPSPDCLQNRNRDTAFRINPDAGRWGKRSVSAMTLVLTAASTSALPSSELAFLRPSSTSRISLPISRNSASPKPRVVPAGVPRRTPEVMVGFSGSLGTPFLLQVMKARPRGCLGGLAVEVFWAANQPASGACRLPPETISRPPSTRDLGEGGGGNFGVAHHIARYRT